MLKMPLHLQILVAIVAAILTGLLVNELNQKGIAAGEYIQDTMVFVGKMFMNGLKMIIVPLILSSIITGIATLGQGSDLGRLGGKTIGFYMASSLMAILTGLLVVNLLTPGIIDGQPAKDILNLSSPEDLNSTLSKIEGRGTGDIAAVFHRMLPPNVVAAAANGQMLGLICFGLLFGFYMTRIESRYKETLLNFWQGVFDTMMGITLFIMKFTPIGVFGLVGNTVATTGLASFGPLMIFFLCVVLALAIHVLITLPLALKFIARVHPTGQYKSMAPALLTAFSTASSSGTLPITMECMEKKVGVSNRTTSFVLPLGATINMDGTALYECVAAMFIAQAYGLDLTFTTQFTIVLIALLTSVGVAGIPAASLVAISVILAAVGLPAEGIGLLLVTDRVLDMLRTAVNVFSDSCCATIVARTEGEKTRIDGG
ncbi:dicarboxylate/amino acid:cation symporter [Teredinibacter purpureus]|uniref:dicarboxylate/amino acid:cation symporter n=1 Tax=Teredinibacter purpureus TaxID=2731756 RepID=UPI0005F8669D|nr:dicarboxylate/amino acid:cation symporter [Teredinibacter purpureus]